MKNPLNDSIESDIPREEAHPTTIYKKQKVFVTGLLRNHQVTVKNFPDETSKKKLDEKENLVADKPDCIIVYAGMNDITSIINSLNPGKENRKKCK